MPMKTYKPSNRISASGYRWLFLSTVISSCVVGGVFSFLGSFIYLFLVFPGFMGAIGGCATHLAVKSGKVRNPAIASLVGAITGVAIYGAMLGFDYGGFRRQMAQEFQEHYGADIQNVVAESNGTATENDIIRFAIDDLLTEQTGQSGFLGYLHWTAQDGFSLDSTSNSSEMLVSGIGVWLFWLLEIGLVVVISSRIGFGAAVEPFCEQCQEWYEKPQRLGNVSQDASAQFTALLQKAHYEEAGAMIRPMVEIDVPSVEVHLQTAPKNKRTNDVILVLSKTSLGKYKTVQLNQFLLGVLSPKDKIQLENAISRT
ncbi:MAG: hypothetical protein AAGD25_24650 [Cyanobacteria bacterium P01_F01_bin.150]